MAKLKKTSIGARKFKLYHLPIFPYFLVIDTLKNIRERRYVNASVMFVITVVFLAIWLGGYSLTAVLGYQIVKQNIVDKQKAFNLNPTPSNFIDDYKFFGMINDYRSSNKLAMVSLDDEACKVAQKRLDLYFWQTNIDLNNYKDVCPKCYSLSIAESQNQYNLDSILTSWKAGGTTLSTLQSKHKYGCVRASNDKVALVLLDRSEVVKTNVANTDPITDCVSSYPNCNGESIRLRQSQCKNITCCGFNDGRWEVYPSTEKCTLAQRGSQPTQQTQKPTTPTTQLNFYCYDNINKYSYYTSSGEQCNKNNVISSCKYTAQLTVWDPCTQKCKDTSSQNTQMCLWAYSGPNAAIEENFSLYQECSSEDTAEYSKCLDACSPSYQDALNKCNF